MFSLQLFCAVVYSFYAQQRLEFSYLNMWITYADKVMSASSELLVSFIM